MIIFDPYASHLEVLKGMGAGIGSVLELGSGDYSTRLFLDREYYPDLHLLYVLEPDPAWQAKLPNDPRIVRIHEYDDKYDWPTFTDLILIDSGPEKRRLCDIEFIASCHLPRVKVVIHDFEHEPYQKAALPFQHVEIHKVLTPWTAVCWND
jgi:hypothetical protein